MKSATILTAAFAALVFSLGATSEARSRYYIGINSGPAYYAPPAYPAYYYPPPAYYPYRPYRPAYYQPYYYGGYYGGPSYSVGFGF